MSKLKPYNPELYSEDYMDIDKFKKWVPYKCNHHYLKSRKPRGRKIRFSSDVEYETSPYDTSFDEIGINTYDKQLKNYEDTYSDTESRKGFKIWHIRTYNELSCFYSALLLPC